MKADGLCEHQPNDGIKRLLDDMFRKDKERKAGGRVSVSVITAPEIQRWLANAGWAVKKLTAISIIAVMQCDGYPGVSRRLVLRRAKPYWVVVMDYISAGKCQQILDPAFSEKEDVPMVWYIQDALELELAASFGPESIPIKVA